MSKTTTQLSVFLREQCERLGIKPHDVAGVMFGSKWNERYKFNKPNFSLTRVIKNGSHIKKDSVLQTIAKEFGVPIDDIRRMNTTDTKGRRINSRGTLLEDKSSEGSSAKERFEAAKKRIYNEPVNAKVWPTVTAQPQTAVPVPAKAPAKPIPDIGNVSPDKLGAAVAGLVKNSIKFKANFNTNTDLFDIFIER